MKPAAFDCPEKLPEIDGVRDCESGHDRRAAFSLVEVTLALGVAAFCLVAIFGLLPVGLKSNNAALDQTAANGIFTAVIADLRATPPAMTSGTSATTSGTSQQFGITIPANAVAAPGQPLLASVGNVSGPLLYFTGDGQFSTTLGPNSRFLLTGTFLPNGSNTRAATVATLTVSWPAAASIVNAEGSVQMFVALDRN